MEGWREHAVESCSLVQSITLLLCPSVIKRSIVPMAACSSPTPSLEDMAEEIHALSPSQTPASMADHLLPQMSIDLDEPWL